MLRLKQAAVSASLLLALAACGSTDTQRTATGAGGGALAGAVVAGPVGAVVGGVGGAAAGRSMDEGLGTKADRWTDRAADSIERRTDRQETAERNPSMSRERIRDVQQALNDNGSSVAVDGRWGPETRKALEDFQRAHDLRATGRLDAETRAALNLDQSRAGAGSSTTR